MCRTTDVKNKKPPGSFQAVQCLQPCLLRRSYIFLFWPHATYERCKSRIFRVLLRPLPWLPDYVRQVRHGGADLFLLGWIGDYADAGAFLEPIFGDTLTRFGFRSPALKRLLGRAEAEADPARRAALYRRANREIMRLLPGVPLATTPQPVGLRTSVRGFVPSPLGIESLASVSRS